MLQALGASLNTMTLGGLAIAIGEVVDDAVDRRRERFPPPAREPPRSPSPCRRRGWCVDAIAGSALAVVLRHLRGAARVPAGAALPACAGRLFAPAGLAYILAVLASLAVALTVTPALCLLLLRTRCRDAADPPVTRWLQAAYDRADA